MAASKVLGEETINEANSSAGTAGGVGRGGKSAP